MTYPMTYLDVYMVISDITGSQMAVMGPSFMTHLYIGDKETTIIMMGLLWRHLNRHNITR